MAITKTTSNDKKYMNSKLNYSNNSFVTHDDSKITDEDSTATIMHSRDGKDKCSDQKITRVLDFFNLILYIRNYRITCLRKGIFLKTKSTFRVITSVCTSEKVRSFSLIFGMLELTY